MPQRYKLIVRQGSVVLKTTAGNDVALKGIKDSLTQTGNVASNIIDWSLQVATKTAAEWAALNTVLLLGQLGVESDGLTTTPKFKIGNGTATWSQLAYVSGGGSASWGSISGTLSNQTDLQSALDAKATTSRTLTINGTTYDLSSNRTWTVGDVSTGGSYSNPSWISSLAWSKISGTPNTLSGYGITDAIDGIGAVNRVPYFSDANTLTSASLFEFNGTNMTLGIAVASAGAKMHVKGSGSGTNKVFMAESAGVANAFYVQEDGKVKVNDGSSDPVTFSVASISTQTAIYGRASSGSGAYIDSQSGYGANIQTSSGTRALFVQNSANDAAKYIAEFTGNSSGVLISLPGTDRLGQLINSSNSTSASAILSTLNSASSSNGIVVFQNYANTTTTPANNDGISNIWQQKTSSSSIDVMMQEEVIFTDITTATRTSKWGIKLANSGTLAEKFTFLGQGMLGILQTSPLSSLDVNGSIGVAVRRVAVGETMSKSHTSYVLTNSAASDQTFTCPTLASSINRIYFLKNQSQTMNMIIDGDGSEQFIPLGGGGVPVNDFTLAPGEACMIQNDGTYWNIY